MRCTFMPCTFSCFGSCFGTVLTVLLAGGFAGPALAQAPGAMPGHAQAPHSAAGDHGEMAAAMERMNRDMMAPSTMTGDPDRDFVAMMIPHHRGAIDMSRIYLRTGRDPQMRRMAEKVIADQEREIKEMEEWQAKHPGPAR